MENQSFGSEHNQTLPLSSTNKPEVNISQQERWYSLGGGLLLGWMGLRRGGFSGLALLGIGSFMAYRGGTGHCAINEAIGRNTATDKDLKDSIDVQESVTIDRPVAEVYAFWRKLENLPRFMQHLESVIQLTPTRSEWKANGVAGLGAIKWQAEIVEEQINERISYRSLPGADVDNAGIIEFKSTKGGQSTLVKSSLTYRPPAAGMGGMKMAEWFNPAFEKMVRKDMQRFKEVVEAGQGQQEQSIPQTDPSAVRAS